MRITTIQRKRDLHKKRVAAYARVSTTLSEQSESYEEQREYYERIIKANPEYEFAGVYSDEMSGLDAKHRTGFQQMVDDALAQKIDMILCKSVSRWSRNILDAQTYCELLQGNGVTVVFEKENISTDDPSSSMMCLASWLRSRKMNHGLSPITPAGQCRKRWSRVNTKLATTSQGTKLWTASWFPMNRRTQFG